MYNWRQLYVWLPTSSLLVKGCKFTPLFCSYGLQAGRDMLWRGTSVIFTPSSMVPPRCLSLFDKPGLLGVLRTYCNPDFHGPSHYKMYCILCLLVCLFYVPLENFSYKSRRHHYRWKAANFDLYSALIATEQWAFSSLPHILWHASSVYHGRVWGRSLAFVADRLAMELSLPVLTT